MQATTRIERCECCNLRDDLAEAIAQRDKFRRKVEAQALLIADQAQQLYDLRQGTVAGWARQIREDRERVMDHAAWRGHCGCETGMRSGGYAHDLGCGARNAK